MHGDLAETFSADASSSIMILFLGVGVHFSSGNVTRPV
jgi:hypothetical protein